MRISHLEAHLGAFLKVVNLNENFAALVNVDAGVSREAWKREACRRIRKGTANAPCRVEGAGHGDEGQHLAQGQLGPFTVGSVDGDLARVLKGTRARIEGGVRAWGEGGNEGGNEGGEGARVKGAGNRREARGRGSERGKGRMEVAIAGGVFFY